jgi:hypothetical protein
LRSCLVCQGLIVTIGRTRQGLRIITQRREDSRDEIPHASDG